MISFSCSCGKKYQLPDRTAGREVRCNQCQKTLIVPDKSQTNPLVPLEDRHKATESALDEQSVVPPMERTAEQKANLNPTQTASPPTPIPVPMPAQASGQSDTVDAATGQPTESTPGRKSPAMLILFFLLAILLSVLGGYKLREQLAMYLPPPPGQEMKLLKQEEGLLRAKIEKEFQEKAEQDRAKQEKAQTGVSVSETAPIKKEFKPVDWNVGTETSTFAAKAADGKSVTLTRDSNPVAANKTGGALDAVAAALSNDSGVQIAHTVSMRVDSKSSEPLRVIWPGDQTVDFDAAKIKEFYFSLYLPEKPNADFKPVKPPGIDKTLELASFYLRLSGETGFVDFVPVDNDQFVALIEKARRGWNDVRIPLEGNEHWKRIDQGLVGPLRISRIEFIAKPTGRGVIFWIDRLGIVEN